MTFEERKTAIIKEHEALLNTPNTVDEGWNNGIFDRYQNPVLTNRHIPLTWRYDFSPEDNPYFMERIGVNAVFNAGAIYLDGTYILVARVEGSDRKSYFAVARSKNGTDQFRFDPYPIQLPYCEGETNVYDMRLTQHEDGWIYGTFCSESKDPENPDLSAANAACGIVRTRDLVNWERLDNLVSPSQQRNVVLHPEFVDGKYLLYTRPSDSFIEVGSGGGIGAALVDTMEHAVITEERIIDARAYHTITESKNGAGAPPIKTPAGWLHIAHGVRNTAAGLRYVLYCFLTDLAHPEQVIAKPGGYFMAPYGSERVGDVSNVVFCNGAVKDENGNIYIYYASSDTRLHAAVTTEAKMIDYCKNTPADDLNTFESVKKICALIDKNTK